ncbi:putative protein OS=Tsukamurella paurometabola (strain ATCC 8368 / DSM / CCUG 35730 /CIP 100753 / JCM 10117 / KCTC 9821 / NBRC 16120 / NCIMB 702349/ NCTC 13040) OX=521096 GN=Tpau_4255 PE=4 SV=1 [Tsukamurella paurometabola]|uniref:Uncharacterized protein n=1 Tax=Tsukamurella paurometabola (strain ATCC 8368 / DSM 20162 / CCUG 35730 / CIP 100753 / JCM 10117 / KCTC 9821 / NBRC 16120 / NCIMB 702349 / NCTC 13040) TaxID=521096 RepID=D5UYX6_TSUPD|nr:hypothetical protein [Tsukamurella paurometabola]ADG80823.1 conserved hypothetical protein [Tsukamurella paurometabola DSM 20162]SUQ39273.1 Uncharacterised protein [Tsukamurella paurometabola]
MAAPTSEKTSKAASGASAGSTGARVSARDRARAAVAAAARARREREKRQEDAVTDYFKATEELDKLDAKRDAQHLAQAIALATMADDGLNHSDIAELTGASASEVSRLVSRGRKASAAPQENTTAAEGVAAGTDDESSGADNGEGANGGASAAERVQA